MDKEYIVKTLREIEATVGISELSEDDKETMSDLIEKIIRYFIRQYKEFNDSDDIGRNDLAGKFISWVYILKEAVKNNPAAWEEIGAIREEIAETQK